MSAVALPMRFARLVKIEHTVFALPFAYIGALLSVHRVPSAHDLVWITVAMIGARSAAMGLNRLIDAEVVALAEVERRSPHEPRRERQRAGRERERRQILIDLLPARELGAAAAEAQRRGTDLVRVVKG